jgi:hypothetical protein
MGKFSGGPNGDPKPRRSAAGSEMRHDAAEVAHPSASIAQLTATGSKPEIERFRASQPSVSVSSAGGFIITCPGCVTCDACGEIDAPPMRHFKSKVTHRDPLSPSLSCWIADHFLQQSRRPLSSAKTSGGPGKTRPSPGRLACRATAVVAAPKFGLNAPRQLLLGAIALCAA